MLARTNFHLTAPRERQTTACRLAQSLSRRYALILVLIASLIAVDAGVIEPALVHLNAFAPAINLAGRQRMLSQKLTKTALAIERSQDPAELRGHRQELDVALSEWSAAHESLKSGGRERRWPQTSRHELVAALDQLQPDFVAIHDAAERLLNSEESPQSSSPATARELKVILAHEPVYLGRMETVVGMYEAETHREIAQLRITSLGVKAVILLLMIVLGVVVLYPATRMIRQQVEDLELRVLQRTTQLSEVNSSLATEIAERLRAEARTRQLLDQFAHTSRVAALGELATGLAHEINQPLGAVASYAECCDLMVTDELPQSQSLRQTLTRIKQAALRAGEVIRRLRRFVQKQPVERAELVPASLLQDLPELCGHELRRHAIELQIVCPRELPTVIGDAIQLQQVLLNLIQNSIDALQEHAAPRQITVRLQDVADDLQVDVADSGPGFVGVDPETLFNPFMSTKPNGLGMGLAISRSIIQEHGGRMWVGEAPQGGAVVSFILPALRADLPARLDSDPSQEAIASQGALSS